MPLEVPRYSPTGSKPGTIKVGSASWAVLAVLRKTGAWMTHAQLLLATQRSTKSVCWALLYLQALSLIESGADNRNSRYKRYRAKKLEST
ncbi:MULTISPECIES: hypothetical protein [Giesbergeria]